MVEGDNMVVVNTSLNKIKEGIEDGWLNELAIHHYLKCRFKNGCLYSYRSRMKRLAYLANISECTLYNYLRKLKTVELTHHHKSNLVLISFSALRNGTRRKCRIHIREKYSVKEVEYLLIGKLLENRGRQQAYNEGLRRAKRQLKCMLSSRKQREEIFAPSFSLRTIAKLINSSPKKSQAVISNLNRLGIIETVRSKPRLVVKRVRGYTPKFQTGVSHRFVIKGNLYEMYGNRHYFLQYPIIIKPVELKRLIMIMKSRDL